MDFWKKRGGNSNLKSLTTPIFVQGEVTTPFLPVHMCNISVLCLGSLCSIMVHWTPLCGVEVLIPQTVALYDAFLFIIRFMHWHMHQLHCDNCSARISLQQLHCDNCTARIAQCAAHLWQVGGKSESSHVPRRPILYPCLSSVINQLLLFHVYSFCYF